jgi:hypothetical protein
VWSRSSGTACWMTLWVPGVASVLRLLECFVNREFERLEDIHIALDRDRRATLVA